MNISAIIAEYNPLHKGHVYHIERTKEATNSDAIVCVMSGNYVQRGMPSLIDKWNRTKAALRCGVDLVLELPVIYSLSSAEFFAFGAVSLLNSIGVIDSICFGSEIGEINFIKNIATTLVNEPLEFKIALKDYLSKGYTYPAARSKAIYETSAESLRNDKINIEEALSSSNNILGIEYMKSLIRLNSTIEPYTITRIGGNYNSQELDSVYSSATSIRKSIRENTSIAYIKDHLPEPSFNLIEDLCRINYKYVFENSIFPYIKYKLLTAGELLTKIPDVNEGLENKILKSAVKADSYDQLIEMVKSKRYTYTRLNRILCQYFIGFEKFNSENLRQSPCPYARVLGFNNKGISILRSMKSNSSIPIYTKIPKYPSEALNLDLQATRSYSILNSFTSPEDDYLISPIKVL